MKTLLAGHVYELQNFERCPKPEGTHTLSFVLMDEQGNYHDGTTNEEVLTMLIDRMKYLQGKFPCRENALVITKLEEALMWLEYRTAARKAQGVEGKHEAHKS